MPRRRDRHVPVLRCCQVDLTQYAPPPLTEENFEGVSLEEHAAALEQFFTAVNPDFVGQVQRPCALQLHPGSPLQIYFVLVASVAVHGVECVPPLWWSWRQIGAALEHYGARVWATLAPKYPDVNVHLYAPLRRTISLDATAPPAPRPPPPLSVGNPFLAAANAPVPSPQAAMSPFAGTPTGTLATTADVSAASFDGVSEADHLAALRGLYTIINPDKMGQVCRRAWTASRALAVGVSCCCCCCRRQRWRDPDGTCGACVAMSPPPN